MLSESILYYPMFAVPSPDFIRFVTFYGSKVVLLTDDERLEVLFGIQPDLAVLRTESIVETLSTDKLFSEELAPVLKHAHDEMSELMRSADRSSIVQFGKAVFDRISPDLLSQRLARRVVQEGATVDGFLEKELSDADKGKRTLEDLAKRRGTTIEEERRYFFGRFALGWALNAKAISEASDQKLSPGTDFPPVHEMLFRKPASWEGAASILLSLRDVLLHPTSDVPIESVLEFRRRHNEALLHFLNTIDAYMASVAEAESPDQLKELGTSFGRTAQKCVSDLHALMREMRIQAVLGSLKVLFNIKSKAFYASSGALAAKAMGHLSSIPISLAALGVAVPAAVEVGYEWISKRNARLAILRESPYAYLYHAKKEGMGD